MRARVLAEEDLCGICDQTVDKTLGFIQGKHGDRCANPHCTGCVPHDMRGEVDEIIPRALDGSPTDRSNVHLVHRSCNRLKSDHSLEWARAAVRGEVIASREPTRLVDW